MVDLQHQLLETRTERAQLNGKYHNWTSTRSKNNNIIALQVNWKW